MNPWAAAAATGMHTPMMGGYGYPPPPVTDPYSSHLTGASPFSTGGSGSTPLTHMSYGSPSPPSSISAANSMMMNSITDSKNATKEMSKLASELGMSARGGNDALTAASSSANSMFAPSAVSNYPFGMNSFSSNIPSGGIGGGKADPNSDLMDALKASSIFSLRQKVLEQKMPFSLTNGYTSLPVGGEM